MLWRFWVPLFASACLAGLMALDWKRAGTFRRNHPVGFWLWEAPLMFVVAAGLLLTLWNTWVPAGGH